MTTAPASGLVVGQTRTVDSVRAALPHLMGLVLIITAAIALGRPIGWIGVFAAVGPLVGAAIAQATGEPVAWREAWAFGLVGAALIAGGWLILRAPELHALFVVIWPLGLLAFLLGGVNYIAVSLSRTWRAARGQALDYPWIPDALARAIGLDTEGHDNGNR